jgi:hypothetical protein
MAGPIVSQELSDDELDVMIAGFAKAHARTAFKSVLIGAMFVCFTLVFSGSLVKATLIGCAFMLLAVFRTWRRILEPVSLLLFIAAVIYWCDESIIGHMKTAMRTILG